MRSGCVSVRSVCVYQYGLAVFQCSLAVFQCGLSVFQYGLAVFQYGLSVFQYGLAVFQYGLAVFQYGLSVFQYGLSVFQYGLSVFQYGLSVFQYGLAGHFWCAAGAAIQLFLFAIVGCEIRIKAPGAKTFLQVIRARHGAITHLIVMTFALFANAVISSMVMAEGTTMLTSVTDGTYRYLSVLLHCSIHSKRDFLCNIQPLELFESVTGARPTRRSNYTVICFN